VPLESEQHAVLSETACCFSGICNDEALIIYQEGIKCIKEFFGSFNDDGTHEALYESLTGLYNNISAVYEDEGELDAAREYIKLAYNTIKK